ncbi:hypothetical protein FPSE_02166 [Fusarium pseudograminearum CS3096]|uniref:F-box domain-containing protein n=1 Tax=Fusarium pseudograminearum (strain CS3096) TaxID=1028729 RepID=K3VU10_FUSPC|nr:hypothetical protein FPSE_02166 [Fusarium pseudograminearum CS3096]EKJ77668.1 hypothetical protein FPSE_02166 [Fusarium pseudograminearum CS3096]
MTTIDSLPVEILFQIFHYSSPQELWCLSLTCKRLGLIASTCLWSDIELHEKGYHESSAEIVHPPPYRTTPRPYNTSGRHGWHSDIYKRAEKLFTLLHNLHTNDEARLAQLAGRVRSLCTVIDPIWQSELDQRANTIWNILPYFTRLESLELHGIPSTVHNGNVGIRLSVVQPLANLKFAKLFAYIPRDVATYVLRSNASLERLELGMLDDPKPGDIGIESVDNLNFTRQQTYRGGVIPRSLGGFFPEYSPSFQKLKYIHFCQPCNSRGDYFNQMNAWSAYADKAALGSWKNILVASCQTLETLILDQRPGAGVEDNEGLSEEEFLNTGSSGLGNKGIIESLGSMLTSESELPRLSQVYLYGFVVRSPLRRRPSEETPGDILLHGLKRRGANCEARRGKWCLFDQETGKTSWAKWDGDGCTNLHDEYMGVKWYTVMAKV